jgi:murein endopeptidase
MNRLLWDTVSVTESVDGLEQLGGGTSYRLVGGTCEHHGPSDRDVVQTCQAPDHNHWGTAELIRIVQSVSDSFAAKYPGFRLRINDLSLPFGGKFETDGSWSTASDHQEHRSGTNADVALTAYTTTGIEDTLNSKQRRTLFELLQDLSGRRPGDERVRNHYHIY